MTTNFIPGIDRPVLPTLADIQRRRAELLGIQSQPHPQIPPALPTPEAQPTPPPRGSAELKLGEAALYGPAGLAVRTIAPDTGRPIQ
jgi:hypothetical protein